MLAKQKVLVDSVRQKAKNNAIAYVGGHRPNEFALALEVWLETKRYADGSNSISRYPVKWHVADAMA
jgi:hypothetical protein